MRSSERRALAGSRVAVLVVLVVLQADVLTLGWWRWARLTRNFDEVGCAGGKGGCPCQGSPTLEGSQPLPPFLPSVCLRAHSQ